jgi:hypothetical protein
MIRTAGLLHVGIASSVIAFRFPQLFPLLSTQRVLVGHTGKFRKAEFQKITHGANAYPHVISKSDKKRCHRLDWPAIIHADRTHSWNDDATHGVSLNSVELDSYNSVAGLPGVSRIAGDS